MAPSFNHLNLAEQAVLGSCTTAILADGAVTGAKLAAGSVSSSKLNIDSNVNFNEFQALELRIENLTSTPVAGNPGRLIFRTDLDEVLVDTGTSFISIAAVAGVSSLNSLTNAITLAAGTGISITPSGQTLTIAATGNFISALTGDVTATGPGSAVATLSNTAAVKSLHADASANLTGNVQLVSGTNVTLSQVGQVITINSTGGSGTPGGTNTAVQFNNSGAFGGDSTNFSWNSGSHTLAVANLSINSFKLTTTPTNGYVLTSDASGNGTWQPATGSLTPSNFVVGETPSGLINGVNVVFTLANTPTVGKVTVYLNGIRQQAGGNDYSISGATITFTVAPKTGDILLADYMM